MFGKALVEHFHSKAIKLFVIYDNKIVGPDESEELNHEEADTHIPHQVLQAVKNNPMKDITVRSPDTDVSMLLLDLVVNDHLDSRTRLKLNLGKGKGRIVDVQERVHTLGKVRSVLLWDFIISQELTGEENLLGKRKKHGPSISWT